MGLSDNESTSSESPVEFVNILGVGVGAVNMERVIGLISSWVESREQQYICVAPAHSIMDCYQEPDLYSLFNASGMTVPDGMSLVWLMKLRGHKNVDRTAGSDLVEAVMRYSVLQGWKHYFYGGGAGVAQTLKSRLEEKYPGVKIVGEYSPPFRPLTSDEDREVVEQINASAADIVWVGISSPRQERWMAEHMGKVNDAILVGVGAAFDFLSGQKIRAPLWMQRSGLEWLHRFVSEPRRLWRRYSQYPLFILLILAESLGFKVVSDDFYRKLA
jgi:N-acetylglucosaminyldiphosphoundecaprenol N-acetyl-beta-D-mannosaminyltransferase